MAQVSIFKGENRRDNIRRALEQLPAVATAKLSTAHLLLIKPNLVHHQNQLASTHIDAVRGVLDFIRARTKALVIVGDASYYGTIAAFRNFGYENLPNEYPGVRLLDLNGDATVPGFYERHTGERAEMQMAKTAKQADFKISLALLKTHRDTGVSLSVKNWAIGTWVVASHLGVRGRYWSRVPYLHDAGEDMMHANIAGLYGQNPPHLAVLDGTIGMEGEGPTHGSPLAMDLALAGDDAVAVDSVASELMGFDPRTIKHLALAADRGYGVLDKSRIELRGETNLSSLKKDFKKPDTWDKQGHTWKKAKII